jgi:hypothetical protein
MNTETPDLLDIVQAVAIDLRHNQAFCALLTELDNESARRVTKQFIEWSWQMLKQEHEKHLERVDT